MVVDISRAEGYAMRQATARVRIANAGTTGLLDRGRGRLEGVVRLAAHPPGILGVANKLGQDVTLRLEALCVEMPLQLPVEPQELDHQVVIVILKDALLEQLGLFPREVLLVRRLQLVNALDQDVARKVLISPSVQLLHPEPFKDDDLDAQRPQLPGDGEDGIDQRDISLEGFLHNFGQRHLGLVVGEVPPHEDHLEQVEGTGPRRLLREVAERAHDALVDRADDLVLDPPRGLLGLLSERGPPSNPDIPLVRLPQRRCCRRRRWAAARRPEGIDGAAAIAVDALQLAALGSVLVAIAPIYVAAAGHGAGYCYRNY
ncbi:hypothetical protein PG985_002854 [Apiospora marii]|uniref:uncharacterized protein n=1 Tax=Apiospora marii TaxID=335849 RepID=UPI00312CE5BF